MRRLVNTLVAATVLATISGAASAQGFNVQVGPRGVDIDDDRPRRREIIEERRPRREVVEERIIRRDRPARTVCRTVVRERVRGNGVVVRRPVEECRTVRGGGY